LGQNHLKSFSTAVNDFVLNHFAIHSFYPLAAFYPLVNFLKYTNKIMKMKG